MDRFTRWTSSTEPRSICRKSLQLPGAARRPKSYSSDYARVSFDGPILADDTVALWERIRCHAAAPDCMALSCAGLGCLTAPPVAGRLGSDDMINVTTMRARAHYLAGRGAAR